MVHQRLYRGDIMVVHDSSIWDLMSGDSEEGYPLGIIWIHGGIEISNGSAAHTAQTQPRTQI